MKSNVRIRRATEADVGQLVALDAQMYEDITASQTADPGAMFRKRVRNSHGWFWVAEIDGRIEGLLAAQPTIHSPESFQCWEECTADGTFEGSYAPDSDVMYVS